MSFTTRTVRLKGTADLYGTLIRPGVVRWEGGAVTRVQPGAVTYPHVAYSPKTPVARVLPEPGRTMLTREDDSRAFAAVVDNHPRHVEARPYDPRLDRVVTRMEPVDEDEMADAYRAVHARMQGRTLRRWSEMPSRRALIHVARERKAGPTFDTAVEMLRDARHLDGRSFLNYDEPHKLATVEDTDRDALTATWEARDPAYSDWVSVPSKAGLISIQQTLGARPARAIGTLAGNLAARAHRMRTRSIIHDRRFVAVQKPMLAEDGAFRFKLVDENYAIDQKTGRVRRHTASKFYDSVEEATAAVARIKAHLEAQGYPVEVYRVDPLEDHPSLSPAARKWRATQRELQRTTAQRVIGGRKVRVRIPTLMRGITSIPVAVVEQHNPNRKVVAA